jgi:membrane protease YdiL (CAAX protease family)
MSTSPEELHDALWTIGIFLAGVTTWLFLGARLLRSGTVLLYEPRRPVPWNVVATAIAGLYVAMGVISSMSLEPNAQVTAEAPAMDLALVIATQFMLMAVYLCVVAVLSNASREDLGIPRSIAQAMRDVATGVTACLAAYLPVGLTAVVVHKFFGAPELHPMIQQIQEHADPWLLAVGFVSAVVVAPISEEVAFRLLLQGWLEKWEARLVAQPVMEEHGADTTAESIPTSPMAGVAGMPYGAMPILVTSTLFAWAHVGHGTDPFPLFVLSLFLGFVYQRTHRILPSIVLHATFNLISMLVFWQTMYNK